jgi:hypothetical protein
VRVRVEAGASADDEVEDHTRLIERFY